MGSEGSKVAPGTDSLLLEVATFDATTVRRTSTHVGLRTDSSARFEKTLDPKLPLEAAGHFARLLLDIVPEARFPSPPTDEGSWTDPSSVVPLRNERVRTALGKSLSDDEIRDILERLQFRVEAHSSGEPDLFDVHVPSFRATKDITIEQDLVEEIGRIHRYGNIDEQPLHFDIVPPPRDERTRRSSVNSRIDWQAVRASMRTCRIRSSEDALLEKLGELDLPYVSVINPVNQAESKIRRRVAPSLLLALEANRRNRSDVRLFEIGKAYEPENGNERGEPRERHLLALAWAGTRPGKQAAFDENRLMGLQAIVNDVVQTRGCGALVWSREGTLPAWAHPGKCLFLRVAGASEPVAVLAELETRARAQDWLGWGPRTARSRSARSASTRCSRRA